MALTAARNSTYRHKHGAVIVAGGRVMGVGWSKGKNHPMNVSDEHVKHCSVHAEVDSMRGLERLRRASCFVARIDAFGLATLAKPCGACRKRLIALGISRVYWTIDPDTAGTENLASLNEVEH